MQFHISQVTFPPDAEVVINDVSWVDFERFMDELGERSSLRIHYSNRRMHLMAPSAGHEDPKIFIGRFVEYLLDSKAIEFRGLGSVTLRKQSLEKAVEADECFYIEHEPAIRGKAKISLDTDPPPDLAIEIDLYSPTDRTLYAALGVPELWIYDGKQLEILVLHGGSYTPATFSPHFPGLALRDKLPAFIEQSRREKRSVVMQAFRDWASTAGY